MKDQKFPLRPASREEAGLFYSNDERDEVLGTVGHLRMDFGSGGKGFHHTWWPHNEDRFNTPEFKEALQEFVDAMRQSGPLKNLAAMNTYCWHNGGEIAENDRVYGFVAETGHYRFCLRCTPRPGDYQGYLYCYDLRQQEMARQDKLVGRVTFASGESQEFTDPGAYLQIIREELPYKRTAWVLANTIQQKDWDGRFSPRNKAWAKQTYIPQDKSHSLDFVVTSHPAVLDGVADQYRAAYQGLGLFVSGQCEPNSFEKLDYEGKVLVLSPDTLKETYWTPQAQLWYAHDGFGCSPKAIGRSIRCTCLGDGEMTRWNRTDFVGVLKDEFLPEWAKEKLMELKGQEQNNDSPAMGGMTME